MGAAVFVFEHLINTCFNITRLEQEEKMHASKKINRVSDKGSNVHRLFREEDPHYTPGDPKWQLLAIVIGIPLVTLFWFVMYKIITLIF